MGKLKIWNHRRTESHWQKIKYVPESDARNNSEMQYTRGGNKVQINNNFLGRWTEHGYQPDEPFSDNKGLS